MSPHEIADRLRGGLIASCQPVEAGPLDRTEIVVALAEASLAGGAAGLRIEGAERVRAVRQVTDAPIIGIVKRDLVDSPVRISPWPEDIDALADAGADIIAFDATDRVRPYAAAHLFERVRAAGRLAMADCSNLDDGAAAAAMGCDFIATTMSGYTGGPVPPGPDFELVKQFAARGYRVMAEGRYNTPALAAAAIACGAHAVTVGSALTRLEHIVSWFADEIGKASKVRAS